MRTVLSWAPVFKTRQNRSDLDADLDRDPAASLSRVVDTLKIFGEILWLARRPAEVSGRTTNA